MHEPPGLAQVPTGAWIRLPAERWRHIRERLPEVEPYAGDVPITLQTPDRILEGDAGAWMAVRRLQTGAHVHKFLVVVYRETSNTDGFVVTAYIARRLNPERRVLWQA